MGLDVKDTQKLVVAVAKAIRRGLERDGFVRINGFGTFKVVTRKPYKLTVNLNPPKVWGKIHEGIRTKVWMPAQTVVAFYPSPSLIKFVSEPERLAYDREIAGT
jgi:hypothetical protein